jgi:hypothetical protein
LSSERIVGGRGGSAAVRFSSGSRFVLVDRFCEFLGACRVEVGHSADEFNLFDELRDLKTGPAQSPSLRLPARCFGAPNFGNNRRNRVRFG